MAIAADATLEELHAKFVETKFSKMPVYENTLDEIYGVVNAQELLHIADQDLPKRKVRELARPALFMPETKAGSELLREMRQKGQPMAMIIDEHGSVAGLATVEDLVEEIVGESGNNGKPPAPDVVREPDGGLVMRGSMDITRRGRIVGRALWRESYETVTTIAGLLSHVSAKCRRRAIKWKSRDTVLKCWKRIRRKVLRLRISKLPLRAAMSEQ